MQKARKSPLTKTQNECNAATDLFAENLAWILDSVLCYQNLLLARVGQQVGNLQPAMLAGFGLSLISLLVSTRWKTVAW